MSPRSLNVRQTTKTLWYKYSSCKGSQGEMKNTFRLFIARKIAIICTTNKQTIVSGAVCRSFLNRLYENHLRVHPLKDVGIFSDMVLISILKRWLLFL